MRKEEKIKELEKELLPVEKEISKEKFIEIFERVFNVKLKELPPLERARKCIELYNSLFLSSE